MVLDVAQLQVSRRLFGADARKRRAVTARAVASARRGDRCCAAADIAARSWCQGMAVAWLPCAGLAARSDRQRRGGRRVTKSDPSLLEVIAPELVDAMRAASRVLTSLGIRHVVVGGLAVTANGSPR